MTMESAASTRPDRADLHQHPRSCTRSHISCGTPAGAAERAKNPVAYAALTCALIGLVVLTPILGTVAIILGIIGAVAASSRNGAGLNPAIGGIAVGVGDVVLALVLLAG
ncbi:MAG: hypothetical protein AB7O95_30360 [Geminicoccaceae bacterium]